MHWLSELPVVDGTRVPIHFNLLPKSSPGRQQVDGVAFKDLQTILLHRSNELISGGKFVLALFCEDEDGHYLGNTPAYKHSMLNIMDKLWWQMVAANQITQQEYERTRFCNYYRSSESIRLSFSQNTAGTFIFAKTILQSSNLGCDLTNWNSNVFNVPTQQSTALVDIAMLRHLQRHYFHLLSRRVGFHSDNTHLVKLHVLECLECRSI